MNSYYDYSTLNEQIEFFKNLALIFFGLLLLFIIRNWYNLYKKRSYRKKNKLIKQKLKETELTLKKHDDNIKIISGLEKKLTNTHSDISQLEQVIKEYRQKFNATLSEKEKEIAKKNEAINHQQKAYERYVNFKNVEANNTRLGAHFIKNVISQVYEDFEEIESSYKTFLGIQYKKGQGQKKIPSIKALKNIFKLLDYNVSALNKESTSVEDELKHIYMFLDLIKYLKPNAKIELINSLNNNQNQTIKIKPTLFFPFVENALKHGSLTEENSFISIDLKENAKKQLSYRLVNSSNHILTDKLSENSSSQFGLKALKQLIDAYYPGSKIECSSLPNSQYMSQLILKIKK